MKLSDAGIANRKEWEEKGYKLPSYDRETMRKNTLEHPVWVHFGAGNIARAFHAALAEKLLAQGLSDTGVIFAEGFDYEIAKPYRDHDCLSILVTLKADGTVDKEVIGSVAEIGILDSANQDEYGRMKKIFTADSLQLATFTVTEKGYAITNAAGKIPAGIAADFAAGPEKPESYMGKVTALLYARYQAGGAPIAMVSTDNCSHNGEKLQAAVLAYADAWEKNGLVDAGFGKYLRDESKVSFPWSMIDKITPRPDASVEAMLRADGVEDLEPVVTSKHSYVAPFVNAEETEYLVIEDKFPNGRPALEKAGVYFTDRETVNKVERMKVTTCLNPLHTALAVYGCLLGYKKICDEMKDEDLVKLITRLGYQEGLPVVTDPGILNPKDFIDTVVEKRLPNPFMPDTPQRIATDTSQKLSIRYGETIKAYLADPHRSTADLHMIPLVQAGWLRYLMGVDDEGNQMELSSDPLLETAQKYVSDFHLGSVPETAETREKLLPLLKNSQIFGVDLEEAGLADRVIDCFRKELAGPGAVRRTLHELV